MRKIVRTAAVHVLADVDSGPMRLRRPGDVCGYGAEGSPEVALPELLLGMNAALDSNILGVVDGYEF